MKRGKKRAPVSRGSFMLMEEARAYFAFAIFINRSTVRHE